jgi:DME family drug/metabolite transporter
MDLQADPTSRLRGRLLVLAAALLWSTSGWFAKTPLFEVWPAEMRGVLLGFWRAVFALVVLVPFVRRPRWRVGLVPMVGSFAVMNVTFLSAMSLTTAANAIWLQSTAPLWVFAFGLVVTRTLSDRRDLAALCCAIVGIAVILRFELSEPTSSGALLGLAAGIAYAGVIFSLRILRTEDGVWLIALNQLVAALVLLPWVWTSGIWPTAAQWPLLLAFGVMQMGVPYVLFARGMRTVAPQEASLIVLAEPVLTPIWVLLFWGEVPALWTLAGGGLILTGLVLRYALPARGAGA